MNRTRRSVLLSALALSSVAGALLQGRDVAVGNYSGWWGCNASAAGYNVLNALNDETTAYCVWNGSGYTEYIHHEN